MVALLFVAAAIIYAAYSWMSYTSLLKTSSWSFWAALLSVIVVNTMWLMLAKRTESSERLFFYALCWDAIVLASSFIVPILLFDVRPTYISIVGLVLFVLGLVVFKIGSHT